VQGAPQKKKKATQISEYFFWKLRRFSRDFFNRVFEPLFTKTPKNAIKKNRTKQPREKKEKKRIFCDEPTWIFSIVFHVFELPLLRNAQKTPLKKNREQIKIKIK
jgi:hypothetical protein